MVDQRIHNHITKITINYHYTIKWFIVTTICKLKPLIIPLMIMIATVTTKIQFPHQSSQLPLKSPLIIAMNHPPLGPWGEAPPTVVQLTGGSRGEDRGRGAHRPGRVGAGAVHEQRKAGAVHEARGEGRPGRALAHLLVAQVGGGFRNGFW